MLSQHFGGFGIEHNAPLLVGLGVLLLHVAFVVQVDRSTNDDQVKVEIDVGPAETTYLAASSTGGHVGPDQRAPVRV